MNLAGGEKARTLGFIFLVAFVGLLAWYFRASYLHRPGSWQVPQRKLTRHDDLFAIGRRSDRSQTVVGRFGTILSTRDGGESWREQPSGTTRALSAVSFADDRHGFSVGSGGTILATTDGGATWKTQDSSSREHLLGVYAASPASAFVVGAFGTFLETSDGGASWRQRPLSWKSLIPRITEESGNLEPNLNAVYFVNSEIGWIVGEFGLVLHTVNGGRTWSEQIYGGDQPQFFAVRFRDEQVGWAVGQQGTVIRTTDGGRRWVAIDSGTRSNLYGISFDAERGLIVGEDVVLTSEDAGLSWKKLDLAMQGRWLSGAALENGQATIVGQGGTIQVLDLRKKLARREALLP
jgi:photosystem II stability/assembly factor-like uncharacterized protein